MPFTLLEPSSINSTATFNFANLTVSGNIVLTNNTNSNLGNSATANYFIGNGSLLTGISAGSTYSNSNVAAYLPTYTGNVSANYFIGNGSQLTGLPASYSNTNVAAYLPTYTGNVSANYFIGNGSQLTNITGANVSGYVPNANVANSATTAGTITTNAQPNITSVGTLSSLSVTGNVSGNYFTGNGSQLTGLTASPAGSNTQVQFNDNGVLGASSTLTFDKATGILSVGTATGGSLTDANLISANYFTGTLTTAAQPNITSVGTLTSLTVTGNVSANYFIGNGSQLTGLPASYSNTNVAAYLPTYTGNVSANYFIGNGSTLTNITGANVSGYVPLATAANTAGTVTTNAQPNITSVGTLSSLTVTGNISAGNLTDTTYVAGTLTTAAQPNITSVGTLTSLTVSGNISGNVLGSPVGFRNVPPVGTKTGSYSLTTSDVGKYVQIGSGGSITIPNSTFSEGDVVGLFNNTTGTITITCSTTTAYIAGIDSSKASMALATRGVATVFFISGTVCVVSGSVT
jgi:hypothetical protein